MQSYVSSDEKKLTPRFVYLPSLRLDLKVLNIEEGELNCEWFVAAVLQLISRLIGLQGWWMWSVLMKKKVDLKYKKPSRDSGFGTMTGGVL